MERSVSPENTGFDLSGFQLLDVRRQADLLASTEKINGAIWLDPGSVGDWGQSLAKDNDIIIYCVRGGSVSNAVIDALHGIGLRARYIAGGIEGWKAAGGSVVPR